MMGSSWIKPGEAFALSVRPAATAEPSREPSSANPVSPDGDGIGLWE